MQDEQVRGGIVWMYNLGSPERLGENIPVSEKRKHSWMGEHMKQHLLLSVMFGFLSFSAFALPGLEASETPFCRFWRGFRKEGTSLEAFRKRLANEFMPATVQTPGKFGLCAYLVVVPPADHPAHVPDEIALVMYASEAGYRQMNADPEGKRYQESHWDVFQRGTSGSLVPQPLSGIVSELPLKGLAFDLMGKSTDWQAGYTIFTLEFRRPEAERADFPEKLARHLGAVRAAFSSRGLHGCLVLMTEAYVMSFMNWESQAAMDTAFASSDGKAIARNAVKILEPYMRIPARPFDGTLGFGDFVGVSIK